MTPRTTAGMALEDKTRRQSRRVPAVAPIRWRLRSEGGAAVLEFALVLPLLLAMLLGIIDFGLTYNGWISLRQGVREADRQASVANFGTNPGCSLAFTGGGLAPSTDLQNLMCLAKAQLGLDPATTRIKIIVADYALQNGGAPWTVGNGVVVCAQYPLRSQTGFFTVLFNGKYLRTKTAMRIEQPTTVPETDGYEADQSGGGWSWCTASSPSV